MASSSTPRLSLSQARRIAIAAQGLHRGKPAQGTENMITSSRTLGSVFRRMQLVQIDSVNVLSRSHYLPFFSRVGNYDRQRLDSLSARRPRQAVEYWAHEASWIRPEYFADLRLLQRRAWFTTQKISDQQEEVIRAEILDLLQHAKPLTAREVSERILVEWDQKKDQWGWNWHPVKRVLEQLFISGELSIASRNEQFERRYALTERVLPGVPLVTQDKAQSIRRLVAAAAQAHGIGTTRCFADYFRLPVKTAAQAVKELVQEGVLEEVTVAAWPAKIYKHTEASIPRRSQARALLSPFDPMVFERQRLERLFGMHYRIGIYTPREQRVHGYYVLPFLLRDQMVARVDLKADRQASTLLVRTAFAEAEAPADTAVELAAELRLMAQWLGLTQIRVELVGDLAPLLAKELSPDYS